MVAFSKYHLNNYKLFLGIFISFLISYSIIIDSRIETKSLNDSTLKKTFTFVSPTAKNNNATLLQQLQPTFNYLYSCKKAKFDWTTSIPIASPSEEVRKKCVEACAFENLHTYYNNEIFEDLFTHVVDFFKQKGIFCKKDQIKIRYTAFDILEDFYSSTQFFPNDVLLIAAPTFGYYLSQAVQHNIKMELVFARPENGWKIKAEDLDKALEKTKARFFLFTNPVNPTGAFYTKDELEKLAWVIKKHNAFVISDEVFSDIYYNNKNEVPYSFAAIEGMSQRTLTLFGLGKGRGIRLSFGIFPLGYMSTFPVAGVFKHIQIGAAEALKNNESNRTYLNEIRLQYQSRLKTIYNQINGLNKCLNNYYKTHDKIYVKPYIEPYSTNILLLTFPGLKDKVFEGKRLENSLDLATFIYSKAGVATVPGEGFFIDGKEMVLRIPISIPASELIEGFKAIKQVFIR